MTRPVRVLYVINSMAQGGAERQMAELVRRLPRDRYSATLVSLGQDNAYGHLLPAGEPRHVIDGPFGLDTLRRFDRVVATEQPDIVHSFMERANLFNRLVAPRHGNPVVISSVRSRMMALRYTAVEGLLARRASRVVVNSVGTKRELERIQRVPAAQIEVIDNIVDFDRFQPAPAEVRQAKRAELGLSGRVIFVPGRISFAKHQLGLFWALGRLKQRGELPADLTVLLAGRVFNPSVERICAQLARHFGLADQLRYLGPRRDITELYAAADWVMLPSLWEGLPNAAIEAHACARPLLLSADANVDQILADGETGHQFATGRIAPMMQALTQALATPSAVAEQMGRAGMARVRARFNPETVLNRVTTLYERLLSEAGRRV